jgi:hypothetical protein
MNRFGHGAPFCGALWQVPASRFNGWSGRSLSAGFGIPVKIVAGRQYVYGYGYG